MDAELKRSWVEELRAGRYTQTVGELHDGDCGRCALGVLGELLVQRGRAQWVRERDSTLGEDLILLADLGGGLPYASVLPLTVMREIGLDYEQEADVWNLNDAERRTFPEIAAWIETYVEEGA